MRLLFVHATMNMPSGDMLKHRTGWVTRGDGAEAVVASFSSPSSLNTLPPPNQRDSVLITLDPISMKVLDNDEVDGKDNDKDAAGVAGVGGGGDDAGGPTRPVTWLADDGNDADDDDDVDVDMMYA